MKVTVWRKGETDIMTTCCNECGKRDNTMYIVQDLGDAFKQLTLCPSCVFTLHAQTSRLALLLAPRLEIY